jgi:hypothetical protein
MKIEFRRYYVVAESQGYLLGGHLLGWHEENSKL